MRRLLKVILSIIIVIVLIAALYFAYVFIAYHRIGNGPVTVQGRERASSPQAKSTR